MKYLSTTQTAKRFCMSARRVAILCEQGRIIGAQKAGANWIILENAEKPPDARIKNGKYVKKKESAKSD